mmetsp:Transcript_24736/g.75380  ORF Transcript_24736/g.75380 Transcript_24736/m.75380 type:complete len:356 (-) Transcript_24736:148-1215(-)
MRWPSCTRLSIACHSTAAIHAASSLLNRCLIACCRASGGLSLAAMTHCKASHTSETLPESTVSSSFLNNGLFLMVSEPSTSARSGSDSRISLSLMPGRLPSGGPSCEGISFDDWTDRGIFADGEIEAMLVAGAVSTPFLMGSAPSDGGVVDCLLVSAGLSATGVPSSELPSLGSAVANASCSALSISASADLSSAILASVSFTSKDSFSDPSVDLFAAGSLSVADSSMGGLSSADSSSPGAESRARASSAVFCSTGLSATISSTAGFSSPILSAASSNSCASSRAAMCSSPALSDVCAVEGVSSDGLGALNRCCSPPPPAAASTRAGGGFDSASPFIFSRERELLARSGRAEARG